MSYDLSNTLVAGVSSRSLFDLSKESIIFEEEGLEAFKKFQLEHETTILPPGPAFPLIKALLKLNQHDPETRVVEAIVMSRNSTETSLRIFNLI